MENDDKIEESIKKDYEVFLQLLNNKEQNTANSESINEVFNKLMQFASSMSVPHAKPTKKNKLIYLMRSGIVSIFMSILFLSVSIFNPITGLCLLPLFGHYLYLSLTK